MKRTTRPVEDRFLPKVDKNGPVPAHRPDLGPCWLWTGLINADGYGAMRVGSRTDSTRRTISTHRLSYELLVGAIPDGLEIDHLCRVHNCVNPTHLEPVTHAENMRRGIACIAGPRAAGQKQRAKTHCPKGHPYSGDNVHVTPRGSRDCRSCDRDRSTVRRHLRFHRAKPDTIPRLELDDAEPVL